VTPWELALLGVSALFTSALTAMVGFGGGVILLGVLLLFYPPASAIPLHGAVQLVSNGWRVVLFKDTIAWRIGLRFMALLPVGVAVGLWFFQGLPAAAIQLLIGGVVAASLFSRRMARFRGRELPLNAFVPLGFVVGILNMMVGVVGPLLAVLVVRRDLNRMQMIGTQGFFALSGHVLKVLAFGLVGFSFRQHLPALAVMLPAVLLGGALGKWLLGRFSEAAFLWGFQVLLTVLALKLILWDGLLGLLRST
jgi:uncharacterized membrane protein YfcA